MFAINRRSFLRAAGAVSATTLMPGLHVLAAAESELDQAPNPSPPTTTFRSRSSAPAARGNSIPRPPSRYPASSWWPPPTATTAVSTHCKELWGDDVFTTRDYNEILARKDIDAVIIGTPDHWHKQASIDAMKAGKDVYCEKPMIHLYEDGPAMIEYSRSSKRILQIGSQRVSSLIYIKAKEILASGAIGQLNMVTAHWDRNSSMGAWNYTVPPDASPETCDWPRFLGTAPKIPFNAEHFFQWRKWKAYGSGVAGDLFVHLFSAERTSSPARTAPRARMATGGLRYLERRPRRRST